MKVLKFERSKKQGWFAESAFELFQLIYSEQPCFEDHENYFCVDYYVDRENRKLIKKF